MSPRVRRNISILLVEDDTNLCKAWAELFELQGYQVHCYANAVELLTDPGSIRKASVLVTDYYLPDVNGVELIHRVRDIAPKLPALLLTGSREKFIADDMAKLGNVEMLHKPIEIEQIEKCIERLLSKSGQ
jgi:FixJ family two-component response regulator